MTTATYPARRNDLALVWHQVRYEQLSFWRNPQAVFFTFVFPVVIIVIFGALFRGAGGSSYFYGLSALQRYGAALEPYASGVYVNDLTDEGEDGVRRAYGAAQIARLTALKRPLRPAQHLPPQPQHPRWPACQRQRPGQHAVSPGCRARPVRDQI